MKNERTLTLIKPVTPIVVTPSTEVIVVKPSPAIVIEAKAVQVVTIQPSIAVKIMPPDRGAWDERGWSRTISSGQETYEGFYVVGSLKFRGRIEAKNQGRNVTAYIYNPPREVKRHAHGACFQLVRDNWFHLHWAKPARNVDDAILYMERVLDESLNG